MGRGLLPHTAVVSYSAASGPCRAVTVGGDAGAAPQLPSCLPPRGNAWSCSRGEQVEGTGSGSICILCASKALALTSNAAAQSSQSMCWGRSQYMSSRCAAVMCAADADGCLYLLLQGAPELSPPSDPPASSGGQPRQQGTQLCQYLVAVNLKNLNLEFTPQAAAIANRMLNRWAHAGSSCATLVQQGQTIAAAGSSCWVSCALHPTYPSHPRRHLWHSQSLHGPSTKLME